MAASAEQLALNGDGTFQLDHKYMAPRPCTGDGHGHGPLPGPGSARPSLAQR